MKRIRVLFIWYRFQDFMDNCVEFISNKFNEMCETFNIKVKATHSHSTWKNEMGKN